MWVSKFANRYICPIDTFKYKKLNNVKPVNDFHKVIQHERERANRNNHQVSLVIFNLAAFPNDFKEKVQLIKNIFQEKRIIDEVGWYKKQSLGVILPYTSSHGAREFSIRLCRTLNFILSDSFCYLYIYPLEDSLDYNTEINDHNTAKSTTEGAESLPAPA